VKTQVCTIVAGDIR